MFGYACARDCACKCLYVCELYVGVCEHVCVHTWKIDIRSRSFELKILCYDLRKYGSTIVDFHNFSVTKHPPNEHTRSDNPVQILRTDVSEGRDYAIFGVGASAGYDYESRSLMPGGGAAVVFCYGFRPSLVDAHVKLSISTSAFTAKVTTRRDRTSCDAVGGYVAGFLEKTLSEWWAKYVILIT